MTRLRDIPLIALTIILGFITISALGFWLEQIERSTQ